jgi:hypothetical protein
MHDTSLPRQDPGRDVPPHDAAAPAAAKASASGAVRPDEMSSELCAFLAKIDGYKRAERKSHLAPEDLRAVLLALGYRREGRKLDGPTFEREYSEMLAGYKQRTKRLFPTWSEIYGQLRELGWRREAA